jgi:rhodanese-related sulfurtransferase
MKGLAAALAIFQLVLLGFNSQVLAHTDIFIPDANEMISSNDDLIVIDVREPDEYCGSLGHVAGAYNYPWTSDVLENSYEDFSLDDIILVICNSGGRSNSAANFLDSKGYLHVYDIVGGTSGWKNTYGYTTVGCVDTDGDGFNDDLDNCPDIHNLLQTDSDDDGIGNACDNDCPDLDGSSPVNLLDFAALALNWQLSGQDIPGDLNMDEIVDPNDLSIFCLYWLSSCD